MNKFEFLVVPPDVNDIFASYTLPCRIDKYVASVCKEFSRNAFATKAKDIKINGNLAKINSLVNQGDLISFFIQKPSNFSLKPENIVLDILYEDENSMVINKESGMVVHPDSVHRSSTLLNALLYNESFYSAFCGEKLCSEDEEAFLEKGESEYEYDSTRPGIVHRLDKDTSGVILTAKNPKAQRYYCALFKERRVKKIYLAIVKGVSSVGEATISTKLARSRQNRIKFASSTAPYAKEAITHYKTISSNGEFSLLAIKIDTGRTHQIRVHLSENSLPIIGDPIYARADIRFQDVPLMLHSYRLSFVPYNKNESVEIVAPPPKHFTQMLERLSLCFDESKQFYF